MPSTPKNGPAHPRARHNVMSAVRDAETARAVIEALERHGVDGSHIALLGSRSRVNPMRWAVSRVGRLFLTGVAIGAAAGAGIGWVTDVRGWAAPLLWVVLGAVVGAFAVVVSSFGVSPAWWRTFDVESAGNLAVGVHTDDPVEAALAARLLESARPMSMSHF